jgi:hypothetical protein
MYQARPSITAGLSQQQLLQLMLLADRFGVPKVLAAAAAAAAFAAIPAKQLEWDIAVQLLHLPPNCAQQPDFQAVQQLAVQLAQQRLGDLEQVWAFSSSEPLQQLLLSLPFEGLKQLLQHDKTCVETENTVVYTIERWWGAQDAALRNIDEGQQLMHLVSMRHCTQYYAATIMPQSPLVQQSFEPSVLPLMCESCMPAGFERMQSAECLVLQKYQAWSAEQRPVSENSPLTVCQQLLSLDGLQAAAEQLFSSGEAVTLDSSNSPMIVQGQPMQIKAVMTDTCSKQGTRSPALQLGVFLCLLNLPPPPRFNAPCAGDDQRGAAAGSSSNQQKVRFAAHVSRVK